MSARSGELVQPGQIVVVLENPDLAAELAELRVQISQTDAKARSFVATGETAKYQAETANRKALDKRVSELNREVAELTVRSPVCGHLIGRELRSLAGQYLQPGGDCFGRRRERQGIGGCRRPGRFGFFPGATCSGGAGANFGLRVPTRSGNWLGSILKLA